MTTYKRLEDGFECDSVKRVIELHHPRPFLFVNGVCPVRVVN